MSTKLSTLLLEMAEDDDRDKDTCALLRVLAMQAKELEIRADMAQTNPRPCPPHPVFGHLAFVQKPKDIEG